VILYVKPYLQDISQRSRRCWTAGLIAGLDGFVSPALTR